MTLAALDKQRHTYLEVVSCRILETDYSIIIILRLYFRAFFLVKSADINVFDVMEKKYLKYCFVCNLKLLFSIRVPMISQE